MYIFLTQLLFAAKPPTLATSNSQHSKRKREREKRQRERKKREREKEKRETERELGSFFKLFLGMCRHNEQLFYHGKHQIPIAQNVLIST